METSPEDLDRPEPPETRGHGGFYLIAGAVGLIHLGLVIFGSALFRMLGFEYSAVSSMVLSLGAGGLVASRVAVARAGLGAGASAAGSSGPTLGALQAVRRSQIELVALFSLPLIIGIVSAMFIPNCALPDGILFYFEVALPGMLIGVIYGIAAGLFLPRPRRSVSVFVLFWVGSFLASLVPGYTNPQIYTYGWQYGFFPGLVWDQALILTGSYYFFRIESILLALSAVQFARIWVEREQTSIGQFAIAVLLVGLVVAASFAHDTLRITTSHAEVDRALSQQIKIGNAVRVRYAAGTLTADEVALTRENVEWYLADIRARLGLHDTTTPITIYLYKNDDELYRYVGTRSASISKPWLSELHIAKQDLRSLKHELTHVLLREVGSFPFYNSWSTGLTEGIAMAMESRYDGAQTLDQYAAQLLDLRYVHGVQDVMSFSGFASNSSQASYVIAGSFAHFLLLRYGAQAYIKLYRSLNFTEEYGKPLETLESEWRGWLKQFSYRLSPSDSLRARYHFGGRSILFEPCLRLIGKLQRSADAEMKQRQFHTADELYRQIVAQSGSASALEGRLLCQIDQQRFGAGLKIVDTTRSVDTINLKSLGLTIGILAYLNGDTARAATQFNEAIQLGLGGQSATYADVYSHLLHSDSPPNIASMWKSYLYDLFRGVAPRQRIAELQAIIAQLGERDSSTKAYAGFYAAQLTLAIGDYQRGMRLLQDIRQNPILVSDSLVRSEMDLELMVYLRIPSIDLAPPARYRAAMMQEYEEAHRKVVWLTTHQVEPVH